MKLLFDENLSRRLVTRLSELFPGSIHVSEVELVSVGDRKIWDYAGASGFTVVTTDSDFFDLATTIGPPPQVVWLRQWRHPTKDAEATLRREAIRIAMLADEPHRAILILDR